MGFRNLIYARRFLLFRHALLDLPEQLPRESDVVFAPATVQDIEGIPNYIDEFHSRAEMLAKFQAGEILYLLRAKGEIAWLAWARGGAFLHFPLRQRIELTQGVADVYGVFTRPDFRNRGLARFGYIHMLRDLRGRGFKRAVLQVKHDNAASVRSVTAARFENYGHIDFYRCYPMGLYRYVPSDGASQWHLSAGKRGGPWFNAIFS